MPATAAAAEPEEPVVLRTNETPPPPVMFRPGSGYQLQFARDLAWTRLILADDLSLDRGSTGEETQRPESMLQGIDLRGDLWTMTPRALTSVASLASALMTQGLSVWEVRQGTRVRQRHTVRAFYKSRGLKVVWRIEF